MLDKHNLTTDTLKQLPSQINNPVAVMKSAPQATQQGYVVLTELVEENPYNGLKEPVISALHLRTAKDGIEVINIASVYGKNLSGLQNMLNHDLIYWNKQKGSQLINAFGLQLPAKIALNGVSLIGSSNIKTETDLSQYQAQENSSEIRFSRSEKQSALDLSITGKSKEERTLWENVKSGDFESVKKRVDSFLGKLDENFADALRPVNDWIDQMEFSEHTSQINGRDHEKRRLKDAMYAAKGIRDMHNSELEQRYLKPILKKIAEIAKKTKGKDEKDIKAMVGTWLSTRYSVEKNSI